MSSVVIWQSPCGRVAAAWNKGAPYTVTALDHISRHPTAAAARRAAARRARRLPPYEEAPPRDHPLDEFVGHRVEVIDREGEPPRRFWIERGCDGYLELATRRSYGGAPARRYAAVRWLPPSRYLIAAARRDLAAAAAAAAAAATPGQLPKA